MADSHAEDPPEDLELAHRQILALQSELAARDDRILELERQSRQPLALVAAPDNRADWLLDWAMRRDRIGLLDAMRHMRPNSPPDLHSSEGNVPLSFTTHTALSAEIIRRCCFNFLDLPAEMRNRIYDLTAKDAFSVPCMLSYTRRDESTPTFDNMDIHLESVSHTYRRARGRSAYSRFGILRVSRQIHKEAHQIYYANMSLDLRFMHHRGCLLPMLNLVASPFKAKLQFVRHIDLEFNTAAYILFSDWRNLGLQKLLQHWQETFGAQSLSFKSMNRIRTLLFNLEAVTIFRSHKGDLSFYPNQAFGFEIAIIICTFGGAVLERLFPRLGDIVTVNDYGSERLRKTGLMEWELHYSRERLPTELNDDILSLPGRMFVDPDTRLMHSATIANMVKYCTQDGSG